NVYTPYTPYTPKGPRETNLAPKTKYRVQRYRASPVCRCELNSCTKSSLAYQHCFVSPAFIIRKHDMFISLDIDDSHVATTMYDDFDITVFITSFLCR